MIDPKIKAQELINKHREYADGSEFDGDEWGWSDYAEHVNAKQAALITVEQIIPCTWKMETYKKWGFIDVAEETTTEYWDQVKIELQKL